MLVNARRLAATVAAAVLAASCGADSTQGDTVTVFAASSLTAAFTEIADAFMAANPGSEVVSSFAGSSRLATQISEGAPADVFASADLASMDALVLDDRAAREPVVFASNVAEIVVGPGNPKGIGTLEDLADPDLVVVQCAPEVPCGRYAEQVLANAGVAVTPKSFEENVSGVVTKVSLGEADAGIVYATDVLAAADAADGVPIPADLNVVAEYPIVVTRDAPDPSAAESFVAFVLGDEGQAILSAHGFLAP